MQHTEDHCSLSDITVFDLESTKVFHTTPLLSVSPIKNEREVLPPRVRKPKRPYSPLEFTTALNSKKQNQDKKTDSSSEVFSCDRCKSPYVVNFARCHSSGKDYRPRRVVDPITKKILTVCNSCRFKIGKPEKVKNSKKEPPSEGEKAKYQEDCANFAASLVKSLNDPDAARLYCPAFTVRPCLCLQKYLTESGSEENKTRAENLLNLLKRAKELSTQKNVGQEKQEAEAAAPATPLRGRGKCRSRMFEDFVLETRSWLRGELHLCERACQRVLVYSNNFLHKQLKTAPDRGARIERVGGGGARSHLLPIAELPAIGCCRDRCVLLARTHARLLESWRDTARHGQRDARRVLAEMLTPSGGSKANCYRFIRMVTGCSHTTICQVNDHMRCTQGEREPPEHGLRRWWREHRHKSAAASGSSQLVKEHPGDAVLEGEVEAAGVSEEEEEAADAESVRIPSVRELQQLGPAEAGRQLRQQRRRLASLQRRLASEQRRLVGLRGSWSRPRFLLGCCSPSHEAQHGQPFADVLPTTEQLVHIVEVPTTTAGDTLPQSAASVSTAALPAGSSSAEVDLGAGLSFSVSPLQAQPQRTVFFLPECESVSGAMPSTAPGPSACCQPTSTAGAPVLFPSTPAGAPPAVQFQLQLPLELPLQLVMAPSSAPALPSSQPLAPPSAPLLSLPASDGPRIIYLDALSCLAPSE